MKVFRQILSLLLLGAYALLLMHDAIPHSHDSSGKVTQEAAPIEHHHGKKHAHAHHNGQTSHQDSDWQLGVIDFQAHTGSEVHHHHMGYKNVKPMDVNEVLSVYPEMATAPPAIHPPKTLAHPPGSTKKRKPGGAIFCTHSLRGPPIFRLEVS